MSAANNSAGASLRTILDERPRQRDDQPLHGAHLSLDDGASPIGLGKANRAKISAPIRHKTTAAAPRWTAAARVSDERPAPRRYSWNLAPSTFTFEQDGATPDTDLVGLVAALALVIDVVLL